MGDHSDLEGQITRRGLAYSSHTTTVRKVPRSSSKSVNCPRGFVAANVGSESDLINPLPDIPALIVTLPTVRVGTVQVPPVLQYMETVHTTTSKRTN